MECWKEDNVNLKMWVKFYPAGNFPIKGSSIFGLFIGLLGSGLGPCLGPCLGSGIEP
jgi:hypothetical protein